MLTAPMEITLKHPADNSQYWKPLVETNKGLKRKLREDKCLYPLNFSFEKVFRRIKYTYPHEVGIRLALRELELRKEVAEKKAQHYQKDVLELNFDDVKIRVDIPLFNTGREDRLAIVHDQAVFHFDSFKALNRDVTFEEVLAEVSFVYMRCSTKFNPDEGEASLKTYLNTAVVNHIRDLWRKRAKVAERWKEFATLTRILNAGEYPLLIEGKWVAA